MKSIKLLCLLLSALAGVNSFAVSGLQLTVQNTNALLRWPSVPGESFIIEYRQTLNTNTPWQLLRAQLAAATGTNITAYVPTGIVVYPPLCTNASSGGGNPAPFQNMSAGGKAAGGLDAAKQQEDFMPYPWNPRYQPTSQTMSKSASENTASASSANECPTITTSGFYQVLGIRFPSTLTNGIVLSGSVGLLVAADDNARLSSIRVTANGQAIPGAKFLTPPFTNSTARTLVIDTRRLPNGACTVQAFASYQLPPSTGEGGLPDEIEVWSSSVAVNITNQILFPAFNQDVGESTNTIFDVVSTIPDADWQLDIFDVEFFFVRTLTGYTANGLIEANWNLIDVDGFLRTDEGYDPGFYSQITVTPRVQGFAGGAAAAVGPVNMPPKLNRRSYPALGRWVVAYQDYFKGAFDQNSAFLNSFYNWMNTAAFSGAGPYGYPAGHTNGQTIPLRFNYASSTNFVRIDESLLEKDRTALVSLLARTDVRNFYFDGHGSPSSFVGITAARLSTSIFHRYRFVFIDGCNTFGGTLPPRFGINGPGRYSLQYYRTQGHRPAAYAGFTNDVVFAVADGTVHDGRYWAIKIPHQVADYRNNFLFYWGPADAGLVGRRLVDAFNDAKVGTTGSGLRNSITGALYNPGHFLDIWGYDQLRFKDYNEQNQWPIP